MSPSARASSHTGKRGQELRQASMTSSRLRGRSATHSRNWIMIRLGSVGMSRMLQIDVRRAGGAGAHAPGASGKIAREQRTCSGDVGLAGQGPLGKEAGN